MQFLMTDIKFSIFKVESYMKKANNNKVRVDEEAADNEVGCSTQTRRKRRRKGVPHRSPLF